MVPEPVYFKTGPAVGTGQARIQRPAESDEKVVV